MPYVLSGTVKDSNSVALNNVLVSVLNASTNDSLTMLTNSSGEYSFTLDNFTNGYLNGHEISVYASYGRYYDEEIHTVDTTVGYGDVNLTLNHALGTSARYCSIIEVRRFTGVGDEYSDAAITDMINMGTKLIDEVTGRTWKGTQTVSNEYYDGDDTDTLWLQKPDVQSITALSIDDDDDGTYTSITVASYVKFKTGDNYLVLDREAEVSNFSAGTKTIKISYTHGNTTPSERVKRLAILIVQNMINFDSAREKQIEDELNKLKHKGPQGLI